MKNRMLLIALLLSLTITPHLANAEFVSFCYHDVADQVVDDPDGMATSTAHFISHLSWLRENHWVAVSLDDILIARRGGKPLPDKAFLLTFDDGYKSFYTRIYPILKAFNYPAVMAMMTEWIETPEGETVAYGNKPKAREDFLSWEQIREMIASGLIEIASHSDNLHHAITGNPQGNLQPALSTRKFDKITGRYENFNDWKKRIRTDLQKSSDVILRETGHRPRAIVWPYGEYNASAIEIAATLGMTFNLTLADKVNNINDLNTIHRRMVARDPNLERFVWETQNSNPREVRRFIHVDLDNVYDPDQKQENRNLSKLLDRVKDLEISTVFLQAYADPDGDGVAQEVYFPNRHLPVRKNLFDRVSWQLRTRAGVDVYAWMPILSFATENGVPIKQLNPRTGGIDIAAEHPFRLSPFVPMNIQQIKDIYADLAIYSHFDGLLFSDDGVLTDFEDSGAQALNIYSKNWDLPHGVDNIRNHPGMMSAWTQKKTAKLIEVTSRLEAVVRQWRPHIHTARNLFALPVLNHQSEAWFAQSLQPSLAAYDTVAIMAMPWMEKAENPEKWIASLVQTVAKTPGALEKVAFELQTVDWKTGERISSQKIGELFDIILKEGGINYGYYPDLFLENHPEAAVIRPYLSLDSYPYWKQD